MATQGNIIDEEVGMIVEEHSIARDRTRKKQQTNLMQFTDIEGDFSSEEADAMEIEEEHLVRKLNKTQSKLKTSKNTNKQTERDRLQLEREWAIERQKLDLEREKLRMEHNVRLKELELEIERVKHQKDDKKNDSLPFKVKLQTYNHQANEDILTFLAEFEAVANHAKWGEEMKTLQLRTLLTGEAREVAQQTSETYVELRKALINRFGKRPHEYFSQLVNIRRDDNETYRGLMARIDRYLTRFIDSRDPHRCLADEYFLKALPSVQAQWIRRNTGNGSVVDAAEDYVLPINDSKFDPKHSQQQVNNQASSSPQSKKTGLIESSYADKKCYKCHQKGHVLRDCPFRNKQRQATYFVQNTIGERLINVPGTVNNKDILFVKDTGSEITLIREDLVDKSCILEGQNLTLYTAIGQPFEAKLALVELDTPYYKGHAQVGLVSDLAAQALLGMDILCRKKRTMVVTRMQARAQEEEAEDSERKIKECGVRSHELDDVHLDWLFSDEDSDHGPDEDEDDNIHREDTADDKNLSLDQLHNVNVELISQYQKNDSSLAGVREKALPSESAADGMDTAFFWECRILKRKWKSSDGEKSGIQLVLPKQLRQAVVELAHDRPLAGHLGMEKTKARITTAFYWPGMFGDIQRHCYKKVKSSYDKNATKREFRPGDEVLVLLPSDASKMKARWKGPYRVICKVIGVNYKINIGGRRRQVTYHSNLLRQYKRDLLLTATVCDEFDGGGQIKPNDAKVKAMVDFRFLTTKEEEKKKTQTASEMVPVSATIRVHNQRPSGSRECKC